MIYTNNIYGMEYQIIEDLESINERILNERIKTLNERIEKIQSGKESFKLMLEINDLKAQYIRISNDIATVKHNIEIQKTQELIKQNKDWEKVLWIIRNKYTKSDLLG